MRLLERLRRRWSRWDTLILLAAVVILAGAGLPLPGYSVSPGRTIDAGDFITVNEREVFEPEGDFLVSTVARKPLRPFLAIQAWLDDSVTTVPKDQVQGKRAATRAVESSEALAVAVALERLGFEVDKTGGGAYVEEVTPMSPAAGRLTPGDVITSVNGAPAASAQEVTEALTKLRGGDVVRLDVESPAGARRTEEIVLGRRPGTDDPLLGVILRNAAGRFEFPVDVRIEAEGFEGGSAGLALTLGLLDVLTPGELTGRNRIAVTGTMEIDGTVGKVGGVTEKATAARRAGARYLLVPSGQAEEAVRGGGSALKVIAVTTLDDAITALAGLGGDLGAARRSP